MISATRDSLWFAWFLVLAQTVGAHDFSDGEWEVRTSYARVQNGVRGPLVAGRCTLFVERVYPASGDFVGEMRVDGQTRGAVRGRVIQTTRPAGQKLVVFERVDYASEYIAECLGLLLDKNTVTEGHFIDSSGHSGGFTMTRKR
ncbi:MAG: hypothetical protein HY814_03160 [Candidatus Riflebacteria bacterium]|nr:hypothetical protein [Candidatus Riflebacteria bacterium]